MRIKNQEKIMGAVKAVLDAENVFALATVKPRKNVSKKRLSAMVDANVVAANKLAELRAELRRAHTEIIHEEYGA